MTEPTDIYLIKREKSRAGCLHSLYIAAAIVAVALAAWGIHAYRTRTPAPTVEFPEGAPDAPLPDQPLPDSADSGSAGDPPAPAGGPGAEPPSLAPTPADPTPAPPSVTLPPPPSVTLPPLPSTPPPAPASASGTPADLASAQAFLDSGDFSAARDAALAALDAAPGDPAAERFLSDLAMPLLASERPMPGKVEYTVASGDSLGKIAGKFNTPVPLIARANGIRGDRINVGQRLLLLDGKAHPFSVTVSKSANSLVVLLDGRFFKRYVCATGRDGKTPEGTFKIVEKTEHPTWYPSGRPPIPYGTPENQLGTHWLALDRPGYGIHGTWDPDSLGSQSSDGCVRLCNDDIEELFSILPRGTAVTITP